MAKIRDTEDCWDGAVDGVPKMNDPFVQTYLRGRDALILQERKLRSGS
jgi:adenosine deaminase CECR1